MTLVIFCSSSGYIIWKRKSIQFNFIIDITTKPAGFWGGLDDIVHNKRAYEVHKGENKIKLFIYGEVQPSVL